MGENGLGAFVGIGLVSLLPMIFFAVILCVIVVSIVRSTEKHKAKMNQIEVEHSDVVQKYINILTSNPVLNAEREKSKKAGKLMTVFLIAGFACFFILPPVGIVLLIGGVIYSASKGGNYKKMFKENVMVHALKEYDSNLIYNPNGFFPENVYNMARFESYDRYSTEDQINGSIDGLEFLMAEVHTEDKHTDKDGHTHYSTVFRGQVAWFNLTKSLGFDLTVCDNRLKLFSGDTHVEIDNPEFEEHYDVFTTDKIKAMKILTPNVTNKILDLNRKYGFSFEIKLIGTQLFFRFRANNLFEPNASDVKAEAVGIALYFEILNGIKEIMHEMMEAMKKA